MKKENVPQDLEGIIGPSDGVDLIYVPLNPLVRGTADFTGAEAVAGVYNIAGTALVHTVTANPAVLAVAGPVIEKAGFFGWEAIKAVRSKRGDKRNYFQRLKGSLKDGLANLLTDICVHDPIYTSAMYAGLSSDVASPEVLAAASFGIAIIPAVFFKHYGAEILHKGLKFASKFSGFSWETFYESRFITSGNKDSYHIFEALAKEFDLGNYNQSMYRDQYYNNRLPSFSDRLPVARLREVEDITGTERSFREFQIGYTLPKKRSSRLSEFNYFFTKKEKARKPLGKHTEPKLRLPLSRMIKDKNKLISFNRRMAYNDELRVTLDKAEIEGKPPIQFIELKVYTDLDMLCEAMQYVMRGYNVRTTTQPKTALVGAKPEE